VEKLQTEARKWDTLDVRRSHELCLLDLAARIVRVKELREEPQPQMENLHMEEPPLEEPPKPSFAAKMLSIAQAPFVWFRGAARPLELGVPQGVDV
jgi:hypothetical protein